MATELPLPVHQHRSKKNLFIWHEGTYTDQGYSNVIGCRDHLGLQVWQDPATRRTVVTLEGVEGMNRTGGYTVRYLMNEETGPFDNPARLVDHGIDLLRLAVAHFHEVTWP